MTELSNDQQRAHDRAEAEGVDGYFDPQTGLFVMTRSYLLRRGTCCSTGCRHCPYDAKVDGDAADHA